MYIYVEKVFERDYKHYNKMETYRYKTFTGIYLMTLKEDGEVEWIYDGGNDLVLKGEYKIKIILIGEKENG